ncbi:hypothetical protein F3157_13605 [Virgibacillus dakarensis]|uniref:hypothetical protein n=1 Tax=Bacillaceae TaxID=186817 RepID=UPI0012D90C4E|nr:MULTISPECIES: hypothetical protein [Bacillaceae]MTW86688.1 hypothetical protein [Virgibacillus dakarensis]
MARNKLLVPAANLYTALKLKCPTLGEEGTDSLFEWRMSVFHYIWYAKRAFPN